MQQIPHLFILLFALALTASAQTETEILDFNVTTGQFTAGGSLKTITEANWEGTTSTLTFTDNFEWKTSAGTAFEITGTGNLTIRIADSKTVTFESEYNGINNSYGIVSNKASLTIDGTGTLNATAGETSSQYSIGLYTENGLTINSGTINATAKKAEFSQGISIEKDLTITGGTVNATAANVSRISAGICSQGSASITGGTVTTIAKNGDLSYGIEIIGRGDFKVSGGVVIATAETAQSGSYGIRAVAAPVKITGGIIETQGETDALYKPFVTLPASFIYQTTQGGNKMFGDDTVTLTGNKYVKIEPTDLVPTDYSLLFDIATEKFHLDIDDTHTVNAGDIEYKGQDGNWSYSTNTLTFTDDFEWKTSAGTAFEITGTGNLTIKIADSKTVTFESEYNGTNDSYGIVSNKVNLTIDGTGTLNAIAGETTSSQYSIGLYTENGLTINSGTINATAKKAEFSQGISTVDGLTITGGIVEAQGETTALDVPPVIPPTTPYIYWTNTAPTATNATRYADQNFDNTSGTYKYVKIITPAYKITTSAGMTAAKYALENETVTLTITPPSGQLIFNIKAINDNDQTEVTLTGSSNTRTFTMPAANVTITAMFVTPPPVPEPDIALEVLNDGLTVRISNIGDIETGTLTLRLDGDNASTFTLGERSISSIGAKKHTDVVITPTANLAQGTYTAKLTVIGYNIWKQVAITYTITPVANEQIEGVAKLRAYVQDGTLHITGITVGEQWRVYALNGTLVKTAIAESNEAATSLPTRAMYIIVTEKQTAKVVW